MTLEEQIRNQIIRASLSVVAKDKASTVAAIRDILILIEKDKEQALESKMSDLRKEVEKRYITSKSMLAYSETTVFNQAIDEVLLLMKKK